MSKPASVAIRRSSPRSARKTSATAEARTKEGHYRSLPKEFRYHAFDYRQLARERDAALYEQTWNGCSDPSIAYEVVRIRRREGFEIAGRFVAPAEIYPNSKAWGVDGFTFTNRNKAWAKFFEISRSQPDGSMSGLQAECHIETINF